LSPAVEDDGGVFRLSAGASSPSTIYTVTWKLTWSSLRSTFEVSGPEITSRPVGECLTCDAG
jgi:hypothetical protein